VYQVDWWNTTEPDDLLYALRGRAEQRKLRLYCCSCARRRWDKFAGAAASCRAVEDAERHADAELSPSDLRNAASIAERAIMEVNTVERKNARRAAAGCAELEMDASGNAKTIGWFTAYAHSHPEGDERSEETIQERIAQSHLLRDVFLDPAATLSVGSDDPLLRDAAVQQLAQSIYADRALPSGNFDPAAVLQLRRRLHEIGFADPVVMKHLESSHPHVRGCWVLDLILGK
jgi:hypothetical protein